MPTVHRASIWLAFVQKKTGLAFFAADRHPTFDAWTLLVDDDKDRSR